MFGAVKDGEDHRLVERIMRLVLHTTIRSQGMVICGCAHKKGSLGRSDRIPGNHFRMK